MKEREICTIALLGQPNSGKSTLFNRLTGSNQHVGNWPGKTVERKEGSFTWNGICYQVTDLPGSYSLSANSPEEIITREYIAQGGLDLVCIVADASQLERSLYMLADFAGIKTPVILVLNMMDIAEKQGKRIDSFQISERLGIPVLPFNASDPKGYQALYSLIESWKQEPHFIKTEGLRAFYKKIPGNLYSEVARFVPVRGILRYSGGWLTSKIIEGDRHTFRQVASLLGTREKEAFESLVNGIEKGSLLTGECKFQWIDQILRDAVIKPDSEKAEIGAFDKVVLDPKWGTCIAVLLILSGLGGCMLLAFPFQLLGSSVPVLLGEPAAALMKFIGCSEFLISLLCTGLINAISLTVSMTGFVFGITLMSELIEETGYMARISYVFDSAMVKLGLQGKAMMPFLVSLGCTTGGVVGTRVIDSWGQRVLTAALIWAVPCGATFAVVPALAFAFFGWGAPFVMLGIVGVMVLHIAVTAKIFGSSLTPVKQQTGLIMELPPYHKPKWKQLLLRGLQQTGSICSRAFKVILLMSIAFWILSYSPDNRIESSLLCAIGTFIEPVTRIFGLSWRTFMAFLSSSINKEAVLGVLSALYGKSGGFFGASPELSQVPSGFGQIAAGAVSKPEALAFLFAITFNPPCVMALISTYEEIHSLKWTLRITVYYMAAALLLSLLVYRFGVFLFGGNLC